MQISSLFLSRTNRNQRGKLITCIDYGMDPAPWPDGIKTAETYLKAIEGGKSGIPVFVEGYTPDSRF